MILLLLFTLALGDTSCNQLLPGMSVMIAGIDKTNVDIRTQPFPALQSVIALTCNQGKKYYDPYTQITFDWPDQFDNIISVGGSSVDIKTFLKDNIYQLELELNAEQSGSFDYIFGEYTESSSIQYNLDIYINQFRAAGIAKSTIYAVQMYLLIGNLLNISTSLQNFIDTNLNPVPFFNEKSVNTYNNLFRQFGTDWIQTGSFGGEMCLWYYSSKSLYDLETSASIQVDASNDLFNIILASGGASGSAKVVSQAFIEYTITNMLWRGGSSPGPVSNYSQWASTVSGNPAPLMINLYPITNLFSFSPALQGNASIARINYFDVALLTNEILPSLSMFYNVLSNIKQSGNCYAPSACNSYPDYPSCGVYICPGSCPNSQTYCGTYTGCCGGVNKVDWFNNQVDAVMSAVNYLKNNITILENEINTLLQSPIINHDDAINVYNQYQPIMEAMETPLSTLTCYIDYVHSDSPCSKWSSISSNKCSGASSSIATACPYNSGTLVDVDITFPSGIMNYSSTSIFPKP